VGHREPLLVSSPGIWDAASVLTSTDFLYYVDDALAGMTAIVRDLGDELANRAPDLPGANTPYAILTHCLGVMEYWGGYRVAGRAIERDRPAEFRAHGTVLELAARVEAARDRLRADIADLDPAAPPHGEPDPGDAGLPLARSRGGVLVHIYEELAQHRGQLEVTRDVLRAPWAQLT
jgi:hypothetical protein